MLPVEKEITNIYKRIPSSTCKPGCAKCCKDMIQFSLSEEKRMGGYEWNGQCSHLIDGKCSVYEQRPLVCRLFGTSEMLQCEGCSPAYYLSEEETMEIIHKYSILKKEEESSG